MLGMRGKLDAATTRRSRSPALLAILDIVWIAIFTVIYLIP